MRRDETRPLFQWISLVVLAIALPAQAQQGGPLSFNALSPEKAAMGIEQFEKYEKDKKMIQSGPEYQAVQRVAARLTPVVEVPNAKWEFVLFEDASPNAFALPGGKVGVHTGLFKVSQNDAQLAAVLGHELGHVTARHSGQRITQGVAGSAIGAIAGKILEKKTGMQWCYGPGDHSAPQPCDSSNSPGGKTRQIDSAPLTWPRRVTTPTRQSILGSASRNSKAREGDRTFQLHEHPPR